MGNDASKKSMDADPQKIMQQLQVQNVAPNQQNPSQSAINKSQRRSSISTVNIQPFTLVWVDQKSNSPVMTLTEKRLREFNTFLMVFQAPEEFEKYLETSCADEKIVLVVSGKNGQDLVPKIHKIPKIVSIVIFCLQVDKHKLWADQLSKVVAVVAEEQALIEKLREIRVKIESIEDSQSLKIVLPSDVAVQMNDVGQMAEFSLLLFLDFLLHSEDLSSYNSFKDFIRLLGRFAPGDEEIKKLIINFENTYQSSRAISWLLREGPFKDLVRRSLLEFDVKCLFALRFFFVDAYEQLKLYKARPITVYRSMTMPTKQIDDINKHPDKLMVINQFFFGTTERKDAKSAVSGDDPMESVLLKIEMKKTDGGVPFAILCEEMSSEEFEIKGTEVLFMPGATFRIGRLFEEKSERILELNLVDYREISPYQSLHKAYRQQPANFISNLLFKCGHRQKAILFNKELRSILPEDHGLRPQLSQNVKTLISFGHEICLVVQLQDHHTKLSAALLDMIGKVTENLIFIQADVDFSSYPLNGEKIHLFTTSHWISSSSSPQPKNAVTYIFDKGGKNIEEHRIFNSINRMIFHLIDRILENYQREMAEWQSIGDNERVRKLGQKIKEIYEKTRLIDLRVQFPKDSILHLKATAPLLYWLRAVEVDDMEIINDIENTFDSKFHGYRTCVNPNSLHDHIVQRESTRNIFIVIQATHSKELAQSYRQFSNVKCVLRYGIDSSTLKKKRKDREESGSSDTVTPISDSPTSETRSRDIPLLKRDDLVFHLTWNLLNYYQQMADRYESHQMLQEARTMLVEARDISKFLSETSFQKIK